MHFLKKKPKGQALVDYALVFALIVLVAMIAARALGEKSSNNMHRANIKLGSVSGLW